MTIEQTNVIDAIGLDDRSDTIVLTISDHLEWGDNEHLYKLQEKINTYLAFIESGEILKTYPSAKGKQLCINLACLHAPDADGKDFLAKVAGVVSTADITFTSSVLK